MERPMRGTTFKSPEYKLLPFFHRSRDGWKVKAKERLRRIKRMKKRVTDLEASRERWKEKARAYQEEMIALKKEIEGQKNGSI